MIVGVDLVKGSSDSWAWDVDFRNVLEEGEMIASGVFRVIRERDQLDVTNIIKVGNPVPNGATILRQVITGGDNGERYVMELRGTTSAGYVWDAEQRLIIKDIL
jgi:hypothetical protein